MFLLQEFFAELQALAENRFRVRVFLLAEQVQAEPFQFLFVDGRLTAADLLHHRQPFPLPCLGLVELPCGFVGENGVGDDVRRNSYQKFPHVVPFFDSGGGCSNKGKACGSFPASWYASQFVERGEGLGVVGPQLLSLGMAQLLEEFNRAGAFPASQHSFAKSPSRRRVSGWSGPSNLALASHSRSRSSIACGSFPAEE